MKLKRLHPDDIDILFAFEQANKDYFASIGLPRSQTYYDFSNFCRLVHNLLSCQEQDTDYFYLIFNDSGHLVGRINLTNVVRGPLQKAELGYRIGEGDQGNGYASKAVETLLLLAKDQLHLHRIEAGTSPENYASQKVLEKNGFRHAGTYKQYQKSGDHWLDSLLFERIL